MLGFGALTTNCLCARHNSLLSPIDTVGANFFEAIQKSGTTDNGPGLLFLLSGHDVERWLLRSLAIFGVSGNFSIDGAVIDADFVNRLRIVELLEDVKLWKKPVGFYLTRGLGHQFWRRDNIQIAPVVKTGGDEIAGITLDIQGLEFALLATITMSPALALIKRSTGQQRLILKWAPPPMASSSHGKMAGPMRTWPLRGRNKQDLKVDLAWPKHRFPAATDSTAACRPE